MIIYPAIDIRGGRCVRLVEGDFARETAFDADPAEAAARWADAGAEWIHVVDLDGSVQGQPVNRDAVTRIRTRVTVPIQLGGGLRTLEHVDRVFALGVDRAVLGTAIVQSPEAVAPILERWGARIAGGLDARDGMLATRGWLDQSEVAAERAAVDLEAQGLRTVIFTDIRRDGTFSGPNLPALTAMVARLKTAGVIASGGVGVLDDILAIELTGAAGVIIGRALYDRRVDLREAIAATRSAQENIQWS